jgi:uncharacterized protein (DUF362 family)
VDRQVTRRSVLGALGGAALAPTVRATAPAAPVAVTRCPAYGRQLLPALEQTFDRLGGLGQLVKGKTVTMKINLNGGPNRRLRHMPLEDSHWPHPDLIGATLHLMGKAGARRITIVESAWAPRTAPLEDHLLEAGWDPRRLMSSAAKVEFVNTNFPAKGNRYARLVVPGGGLLFPSYLLHPVYEECDVFVSVGKPKDHSTNGVTLGMKNVFGTTPLTIYGSGAGVMKDNEESELPRNGRMDIMHYGKRQPSNLAPAEVDPASPRDDGYRLPRIITDLCAARPVHLTIMDAVKSMAGGQGVDRFCDPVSPGLIVAGTNVVSTDAVMMALMNYDPMSDKGQEPWGPAENMLRVGEDKGIGTRDLRRIEVVGTPIREAICDYRSLRVQREERRRQYAARRREAS